jgi:hypothetical protein
MLDQQFINVLPVPGPYFSDSIGLDPTSSYYALLVRNIAPSGEQGPAAFRAYTEQPHLAAWRLTPLKGSFSINLIESVAGGGVDEKVASYDDSTGSSVSMKDARQVVAAVEPRPTARNAELSNNTSTGPQFPLPDVISRNSDSIIADGGSSGSSSNCLGRRRLGSSVQSQPEHQDFSDDTTVIPFCQQGSSTLRMLGRRLAGSRVAGNTTTPASAAISQGAAPRASMEVAPSASSMAAGGSNAAHAQSTDEQIRRGSSYGQQQAALDSLVVALDQSYGTAYDVSHGLGR